MAELLIELLSEEIPARMQARAAGQLAEAITSRLEAAALSFERAANYVTPRRLVVVVEGLPSRQPDLKEEKKGPRVGAPDQAIQGFLKANGLASVGQAEVRESAKGAFYFAVKEQSGQPTEALLPSLIAEALQGFAWPKSMRWGKAAFRWVRPLHGVLVLLDGLAIGGRLDLGNGDALPFATETSGHRFLAPGTLTVASWEDYLSKLRAAKVLVDQDERRQSILDQAARWAATAGLEVKQDPGLIEEVTGLVEWPVVLPGRIDPAFMDLPPEVLTTSMRSHQKYIALQDSDGALAGRFLLVANMETADQGAAIITGNERVLRARLSDAQFFWDQDRKRQLSDRVEDLRHMVFHAKLGSLAQKVDRTIALARDVAAHLASNDLDLVESAARLAKADLTTGMVGEFPELQGVMGRYYALNDGEDPRVANAVAEHYSPLGPGDRCPTDPVSVSVALADKIDSLVGLFAIGEAPTGSKDPFALRRAALGVIRLIVENGQRLPLRGVLAAAFARFEIEAVQDPTEALLSFMADRLKVVLKDKGVRHDLVSAIFAVAMEDDLVRLLERVEALDSFLSGEDGGNLLIAYRRAANIVRIEEKRDKVSFDGDVHSTLFQQDEERVLYEGLQSATARAGRALSDENYTEAMRAIAEARGPVDRFFDRVTVNADEPELRANRLRLLSRIGATLNQVADFSRIEG